MPKIFPSYTHCIVQTVKDAEAMENMKGIMAFVDVCLGSDSSAIRFIGIKKMTGPITGLTAHIPKTPFIKEGKTEYHPVVEAEAAAELKQLSLVAFDKVKQQFGLKFGKKYRVFEKKVEEL